ELHRVPPSNATSMASLCSTTKWNVREGWSRSWSKLGHTAGPPDDEPPDSPSAVIMLSSPPPVGLVVAAPPDSAAALPVPEGGVVQCGVDAGARGRAARR